MLRVDLRELRRRGKLPLQGTISGDDPLWGEIDFSFVGDVEVDLTAEMSASEQVVVQGRVRAEILRPCRRCLAEARELLDLPLYIVWGERVEFNEGEEEWEGSDDELRVIDPGVVELEVDQAVREEFLLATSPYSLCRPDCRGLCPVCGVDRNVEKCDCDLSKSETRWEGLRALLDDSG